MHVPLIHGKQAATFQSAFVLVTKLHVVAKDTKIEYVSMPS